MQGRSGIFLSPCVLFVVYLVPDIILYSRLCYVLLFYGPLHWRATVTGAEKIVPVEHTASLVPDL